LFSFCLPIKSIVSSNYLLYQKYNFRNGEEREEQREKDNESIIKKGKMAQASNVFDLLSPRERETLLSFLTHRQERLELYVKQRLTIAFRQWLNLSNYLKKIRFDEDQRRKVLDILRTSTRGQRSTMEKEILRRFVNNSLTCIPKSISFTEMDQLCNELDWYPLLGRSIIFLQGDFGNVYYLIAGGNVGLFLEPSKDREMEIAREFGNLRGHPFSGTDEDLKRLGNNILTLSVRIFHCFFFVFFCMT
jgi:hypothetical protein